MTQGGFAYVWSRIIDLAGQTFSTKTGLVFSYIVTGQFVLPSRTAYQIAKSDFEKAFALGPTAGPGCLNQIVRGPSYIWAILHDDRIQSTAGPWSRA